MSHALNWLVKQYRFVLGRLRVLEYLQSHPQISGVGARGPSSPGLCVGTGGRVELLEHRVMLAGGTIKLNGPAWLDQGPGAITGAGTHSLIPAGGGVGVNPVVGAVQAVATISTGSTNAANIIYVATVNGGIWRTLDGLSPNPTWQPLGQNLKSLAFGALSISPFDNAGNSLT